MIRITDHGSFPKIWFGSRIRIPKYLIRIMIRIKFDSDLCTPDSNAFLDTFCRICSAEHQRTRVFTRIFTFGWMIISCYVQKNVRQGKKTTNVKKYCSANTFADDRGAFNGTCSLVFTEQIRQVYIMHLYS